ncbi:MAG: SBBP repeat-containing protein [Dehalococcoidia bacterium]
MLITTSMVVILSDSPADAWSTSDGAVLINSTSSSTGSVLDVHVDDSGNVYSCGYFRGTGDVDPDPGTTENETATGLNSSLVTKYDSSGNRSWHVLLDADDNDQILDCTVSSDGRVAVAGRFKGTMDFGSDNESPGTADSTGDWDAYVALIEADGTVAWGKSLGGTGDDQATGVDFGPTNKVYVTGYFSGTADIDFDPSTTTNVTSAGLQDVFFSKITPGGNVNWVKTWGGVNVDIPNDLAIDHSANRIYIGGYLGNNATDYDPGSGTVLIGGTSGGQGGYDSWISKFTPSGDLDWAKNFGSNDHDRIEGLAADSSGNVYGTGYQKGTGGDWDTGLGTIQLGSSNFDPYTIKLDSSGATQWAFAVGGSDSNDKGFGVTVDGSGNVYTTGHYRGTADLDSGSGTSNFTSNVSNKNEAFLLKHNSSGVHQWAKVFPSGSHAEGRGVTTDGSGNVYISGYFQSWMDFDPSAGDATVISAGSSDGYVAKYSSGGVLASGNASLTANPPSGYEVVHGPANGSEMQGFEAEVVNTTPLCTSGQWQFNRPGDGIAVRHYVVETSALNASGLGIGAYIKSNFTSAGSTMPHHNLLWVGSQIDHDGNTSSRKGAFKNLGWNTGAFNFDVASGAQPVTFQIDSDGSFKWIKNGVSNWSASTIDYDGSGTAATGVIPSGWCVYMAFAAKNAQTKTIPDSPLNATLKGFTLSESSLTVSEPGTSQTFTVVLIGPPSSDVVIDGSSSNTSEATVSGSLTFSSSNWNSHQIMTVTGVDDTSIDGSQNSTITVSVNDASSDDAFESLPDQTVAVTTTDDDVATPTPTATPTPAPTPTPTPTATPVPPPPPTATPIPPASPPVPPTATPVPGEHPSPPPFSTVQPVPPGIGGGSPPSSLPPTATPMPPTATPVPSPPPTATPIPPTATPVPPPTATPIPPTATPVPQPTATPIPPTPSPVPPPTATPIPPTPTPVPPPTATSVPDTPTPVPEVKSGTEPPEPPSDSSGVKGRWVIGILVVLLVVALSDLMRRRQLTNGSAV